MNTGSLARSATSAQPSRRSPRSDAPPRRVTFSEPEREPEESEQQPPRRVRFSEPESPEPQNAEPSLARRPTVALAEPTRRPAVSVAVPAYTPPPRGLVINTPPPYSLSFMNFGLALDNPNESPEQTEARALKCVARVLREYLMNEFIPILSHPAQGYKYHSQPKWRKSAPAYQQFRLYRSRKIDPIFEDLKAIFMVDDAEKMAALLDKTIKDIYNVVDKALIAWRDEMLYEILKMPRNLVGAIRDNIIDRIEKELTNWKEQLDYIDREVCTGVVNEAVKKSVTVLKDYYIPYWLASVLLLRAHPN